MTNEQIIAQLIAIRASVDAMLALLAPATTPEEPDSDDGECEHPPEERQSMDTMGVERWQCRVCGYLHERKTNEGGDE